VRFCWIADVDPAAVDSEEDPDLRLTVVANGQLETLGQRSTESTPEGLAATGCSTYRFDRLGLIAPAFVIGRLEVLSRPAVTVYHQPAHRRYAQAYAAAVEQVLPFVDEWFGPPREKLQIVELTARGVLPDESGSMLLTPLGEGDPAQLQGALVHQAVHAANLSSRPWIYEGLAQFAQALWRERQQGRRGALEFMRAQLPALVEAERQACEQDSSSREPQGSGSSSAAGSGLGRSSDCVFGQPLAAAYDEVFPRIKGMYVWWMLRDLLGDAVLKAALRQYRPVEDLEPSYVQRLVAAQSPRDLEWFFDDWVYRDRGLPDFRVRSVYPRATLGGAYVVTVMVENVGAAGAQVPVRVIAPAGEESGRLPVPRNGSAATRIEISAKPSEVVVNDGSVPEANAENNRFVLGEGGG
jgi:hypothetical protein